MCHLKVILYSVMYLFSTIPMGTHLVCGDKLKSSGKNAKTYQCGIPWEDYPQKERVFTYMPLGTFVLQGHFATIEILQNGYVPTKFAHYKHQKLYWGVGVGAALLTRSLISALTGISQDHLHWPLQ